MSYRLLVTFVIIPLLIFVLPAKQPVFAIESNVDSISYETLSEMPYHPDLNGQISDSFATEEFIGRVVPSEGITSKGMLVEETPQIAAYLIRTFLTPGMLIILASMIILKNVL